jgi:aryl-alcohol dehydrogenase-like predicted oxidoreductase
LAVGWATAEGTAELARILGAKHAPAAYRPFGATGLTVSVLGFGCYRVDDRVPVHAEALEAALVAGVNVIDTSTNYGDGHSERLVGEVLAKLVRSSTLSREGGVVVSKVGYGQGENLELVASREASGKPFPEVVHYAEGLAHCIHPEWLSDQLGRSLGRLGFDTLDVCLLHNPEYFLSDAAKRGVALPEARAEFYRRIEAAFRHLESEVTKGRIRCYGVSSNTAVERASEHDAVSDARAARSGGLRRW